MNARRMTGEQRKQILATRAIVADGAGVMFETAGELGVKRLIRDRAVALVSERIGVAPEELRQKDEFRLIYEQHDLPYHPAMIEASFSIPVEVFFERVYDPSLQAVLKERASPDPALTSAMRDFELPIGLLSNRPARFNVPLIEKAGLSEKISPVIGLEMMAYNPKPDERAYELITDFLKVPRGFIIYADDKLVNLEAPRRMGFATAFIGAWDRSMEGLADFSFESFEIMLNVISAIRDSGKKKGKALVRKHAHPKAVRGLRFKEYP